VAKAVGLLIAPCGLHPLGIDESRTL